MVVNVVVQFFIRDVPAKKGGRSLLKSYKMLSCIWKSKEVSILILFQLFRQVGFATINSTMTVEMIKNGFPKEYITFISLLYKPFSFLMLFYVGKKIKCNNALHECMKGFLYTIFVTMFDFAIYEYWMYFKDD